MTGLEGGSRTVVGTTCDGTASSQDDRNAVAVGDRIHRAFLAASWEDDCGGGGGSNCIHHDHCCREGSTDLHGGGNRTKSSRIWACEATPVGLPRY